MALTQVVNDGQTVLSSGDAPTVERRDQGLGRDAFLKLLVTKLQHQDPLKPMEEESFIAQMAQFSTLEQVNQMNQRLESIERQQAEVTQAQTGLSALGLVGREVSFENATGSFEGIVRSVEMAEDGLWIDLDGESVPLMEWTM